VGKTKARPEETNFTVKGLERLSTKEKRFNVFDSETRGLGLAVYPSGQKTFFHLQKVQGWPRRTTLGVFPDMSIEAARGKASELNSKLSNWRQNDYQGQDPLERPAKVSTLGEVLDHYVEHHVAATAKNPDHAVKYAKWQFDTYLASLRNRPLGTLRREHVRELHAEIQEKRGGFTANRTITFLRALFNHAIHPDVALWDGANPCAKPKKFLFHEKSRERTIQRPEAPRFFKELAREPHRDLRDFLLIALSTAARRGKVLSMRWDQLDWQRGLWIIPDPKGKKDRKPHVLPLTQLALSVLRSRPQTTEWVFPGVKEHLVNGHLLKGHLTTVKKPWKKFIERVGILDLRIHDLRRTLATHEGDTGASTEVIQKTLGHEESSAATKIYDRSDRRDEVRGAMDAAIAAMLAAGKTSKRKLLSSPSRKVIA
jgi:integrase